ncbi:MAG TPA: alkaline phosphatase family protein, partial [Gemmatimonadaceae bacterium]|nr:alkaline phosphatase family protein [Gemmatimonadaceae bacterium]
MLRITAAFAISLSVASFAFGQGTCSDNHILPSPPDSSGIQNIVFIMMENRSFDHFFGWVPNADGQQTATYYDDSNVGHPTHSLSGNPAAGGGNDPVHFYPDMHDTYWYYNNGAQIGYPPTGYGPNLGWLRQGKNTSQVAIGYYTQADLGFLGQIATQYTVLDKYFSSVLASTWPNRKFAHTGQTDLLDNHNPSNVSTLATIWDSLINLAPSVSAAYYWGDTNGGGSSHLFKFYGDKYQTGLTPPNGTNITKTYNQFLADAATGTLPNVAYVDPGACDDHPGNCDITQGDAWIQSTVNAVINGPQWQHAVVVVTFDEAGGFFDHVNPPRAAAPTSSYHPCMGDRPATCEGDVDPSGKVPLGFRVPAVV